MQEPARVISMCDADAFCLRAFVYVRCDEHYSLVSFCEPHEIKNRVRQEKRSYQTLFIRSTYESSEKIDPRQERQDALNKMLS